MSRKNISKEKIVQSFLACSFDKSAGATSLSDISDNLDIKKASLYNHFESREEMYDASIEYCSQTMADTTFISEKAIESIKSGKSTLQSLFKRLITRYFSLYDSEPLFKMYVFVHTEQYFNVTALKIVQQQTENIAKDIKAVLQAFEEVKKIPEKSEKELKELSAGLAGIVLQQLDAYIALRKETVRQNPEAGAGSLFELPSDDGVISKAVKLVDNYLLLLAVAA